MNKGGHMRKYKTPKGWKLNRKLAKSRFSLYDFEGSLPTTAKDWEKLSTNFLKGRSHEKTQKN